MAFPAVQSRTPTNITAASASHTVGLDSAGAAGDRLDCLARQGGVHSATTFPTDWVLLKNVTQAGTTQDRQVYAYKDLEAGDSEIGAASMNVTTTGGSAKCGYIVRRITGHDPATAPEVSADATGSSTTPNPSSLNPTNWDIEDTLWTWAGGWEGEQTSPPAAAPTNYSNLTGASSGTAGAVETNCRVATAERQLAAASEDPGSLTISVSDDWLAWTIAIRPASAATPKAGTDSATGSDASAETVDLPRTDSGAGTDASTETAALEGSESAAGADASALAATFSVVDSAAGTDAAVKEEREDKAGVDSGAGTDASTLSAALPTTDSGAGADASTEAAAYSVVDSAAGTDASAVEQTTPVAASDTGAGTDASALAAALGPNDTGAGDDTSQQNAALAGVDAAAGTDAGVVNIAGEQKAGSDSATGTDTAVVTVVYTVTDVAGGDDFVGLAKGVFDTATGSESASVSTSSAFLGDTPAASVRRSRPSATISYNPPHGVVGRSAPELEDMEKA